MSRLSNGFVCAIVLLLVACSQSPAATKPVFVTDYGLGPDKWATAWLLTRHAAPGARLAVVQGGQSLPGGIAFDVPSSPLRRQGDRSAFQVAQSKYALTDPAVAHLAQIIHDIEIDFWGSERSPESQVVEQAFRSLQQRFGRERVTPECYLAFFDVVFEALRTRRDSVLAPADLSVDCNQSPLASGAALVPEVATSTLLAEMGRGKSVIFVDVREPSEFTEGHIPGARNITLRDLSPEIAGELQQADYVVSYCVKDFRGFEMAKALRDAGVDNAVIHKPYGIKGWVAQGLPTAGTKALDEREATAELAACVRSPGDCIGAEAIR